MFRKALDLYFPTVVLIFREGSTKVTQNRGPEFSILGGPDFGRFFSFGSKISTSEIVDISKMKNISAARFFLSTRKVQPRLLTDFGPNRSGAPIDSVLS